VRSISISSFRPEPELSRLCAGFSLLELLVGLALSVVLAVAVAPVWLSLQSGGAAAADRTIWLLQERVATARLERDLRLAGGDGCAFAVTGAVLEASASQVVFLERSTCGAEPRIVEWEIVGGNLMRRWGNSPAQCPDAYVHSLFVDSKTMLEGVASGSGFTYVVNGVGSGAPVARTRLAAIDGVVVHVKTGQGRITEAAGAESTEITTTARVGR
jgi:prepilin-type N-terminal cleavage/methylation domain-containing protein